MTTSGPAVAARAAAARAAAARAATATPAVGLGSKVLAVVACAAVGLRMDLFKGVTPGIVALVVTAPLWWPQVRQSRWVGWLVGLTALTIVVGLATTWTVNGQREIDWRTASSTVLLVVLTFGGVLVLLWARTVLTWRGALASLIGGVLLYALTRPELWVDDPWKFVLARPVAVLALLGVAWAAERAGRPRPVLAVGVLLLLAVIAIAARYRSEAGFLVIVALLVVWQALAVGGRRRRWRTLSPALLLVAVAAAVYLGATQLFVSGALGTAIQERSVQQLDASGSLLLGGRPEWSATAQLLTNRPQGYGFGVLSDSIDLQLALNGFASINADPATGYQTYISNYMLFNGFHLHSVAADVWADAGVAGLLLSAFVVAMVVWALSSSLAVGRAEPVLLYTSIVVLWDVAFAPLFSAVTELVAGLFVALVSIETARAARAAARTGRAPVPVGASDRPVLYRVAAAAPDPNGGRRGPL